MISDLMETIDFEFVADNGGPIKFVTHSSIHDPIKLINIITMRAMISRDTYNYNYARFIPGDIDFDGKHYEMGIMMKFTSGRRLTFERTSTGAVSAGSVIYYSDPPPVNRREKVREQCREFAQAYIDKHADSINRLFAEACMDRATSHAKRLIEVAADTNARIDALSLIARRANLMNSSVVEVGGPVDLDPTIVK